MGKLFIIHLRNKPRKDGTFDHIMDFIPISRIPSEICKELLDCDVRGEQFENPYSIPEEIRSQESEIRKLIQTKNEVEQKLNGIKSRILSEMEMMDVKSWFTDTMRLTRKLPGIRTTFDLQAFKKDHPEIDFYPRTFIFGAKAAAGYVNAKLTIKLINAVADVVNNDPAIGGRIKVVFIEDYKVSNAEWIFAAADVSEQISTASKEASGTGNMKFMLNGAITLGTMDGANVEIVEEVGAENAVIFGLSSDEVIHYENFGGYNPMDIFNNDPDIRRVLMQLINGTFAPYDTELFRPLYNSLLNTQSTSKADMYFILKDFKPYAEAQRRIEAFYRDEKAWARSAILNVACSGKFSSDRTIQEYVDDIWHLDKVVLPKAQDKVKLF